MDDKGHKALVADTKDLLARVEAFKYHDFHEDGETFPKMSLVQVLEAMINNSKNGLYDN